MSGYEEDRDYELNAHYDYLREAFGSFCQIHRIYFGGDCPKCEEEIYRIQAIQDSLDTVAGEPGTMIVPTRDRKDAMMYLAARGWKVKAVGNRIVWEAK